jgi:serine/threonine protein kinase
MSSYEVLDYKLIEYCLSCPKSCLIGGSKYGNRVIKISNGNKVVKLGPSISFHESVNQKRALELVDPRIVKIPRVHGFFTDDRGRGYIVMEFIEGEMITSLSESHIESCKRPPPF